MIIKDNEKDLWIKAGKLTAKTLNYAKNIIKEGGSWKSITDKLEDYIYKIGGIPAFPVQISINEYAAHQYPLPDEDYIFKKDDVVKVDVGVCYEGAIGDSAITIIFNKNNKDLLNASKDALNNAINGIKNGERVISKIGRIIEETIKGAGFKPIINLSGHSLGKYNVHDDPSLPNYYDENNSNVLKNNQIIAIEPFATNGYGRVKEKGIARVFILEEKKPVRNKMLNVIIDYIHRHYKRLPFSIMNLTKKFNYGSVRLALNEMKRLGSLKEFPPLYEIGNGLVSQHEHTLLIKDDGVIITTKRDE